MEGRSSGYISPVRLALCPRYCVTVPGLDIAPGVLVPRFMGLLALNLADLPHCYDCPVLGPRSAHLGIQIDHPKSTLSLCIKS